MEYKTRNQMIARDYLTGTESRLTMTEIAAKYEISRERVRQILCQQGVTVRLNHRAFAICDGCSARIVDAYAIRLRKCHDCHAADKIVANLLFRKAKRRDIIDQVRRFAEAHGRTPGGADFNTAPSQNRSEERRAEAMACRAETPIPYSAEVAVYFGSISALLKAAGLTPGPIGGAARFTRRARRAGNTQ